MGSACRRREGQVRWRRRCPINFLNYTFPVGRLFGIPIRVHWFVPLMLGFYFVKNGTDQKLWGLEWTAITTVIYLISVLVHELGHCWMAIRLGGGAERILLWPLGGLSQVHHTGAPRDQIKVSGIGPLTNFLIAGAALGVLMATHAPWRWDYLSPFGSWWPRALSIPQGFVLHAVKLNVILGAFNLFIPAYPLDGGQILLSVLLLRYGRPQAAVINSFIAVPIGAAIAVGGFAMGDLLLGLIGIWVLYEAWQIRQLARMGELEAHPAFGQAPEFDYMPDRERPKRKGWFARWKERRTRKAVAREAEKEVALRSKVDAVLEKVSREGIGSLSADERRILDEASKRSRGVE